MSDLIVRVVNIEEVICHPNAERLEIVKIDGWQIVSGKGNYVAGQTAIHVPPDAMLSKELADQWGVTQYLSWRQNATKGRVKAVKLRGCASYGFLAPNDIGAELGENVAEKLGIEKYEEPIPIGMQAGQMARSHPLFHQYTDIQNLRNYTNKLNYSEPLIVTEKLHGTNSRVGWVKETEIGRNGNDQTYLLKVVGMHRTQRKTEDSGVYGLPFELYGEELEKLKDVIIDELKHAGQTFQSLIFFGEIFGPGVQDLHYGLKDKSWRVFDIAVNGQYMPWYVVKLLCDKIPTVPFLEPAIYTFEELCALAEGESVLSPGQIKEGIVVRPLQEETWSQGVLDPNPKRSIFKLISSDYLTRKGDTTEFH